VDKGLGDGNLYFKGEFFMKKTLYLLIGLVIGFLFAEVLRRQQMERLHMLEAEAASRKARFAQYEREWQEELATMPFDERMDYELWEAGMKLDNWMP
jgi:hypothetical protein